MLDTRLSIEPATVPALLLTCSAAAETRLACAVVSSAAALICWLTLVSSSEELANACVLWTMPSTRAACRLVSRVSRRAMPDDTSRTPAVVRPKMVRAKLRSRWMGAITSA